MTGASARFRAGPMSVMAGGRTAGFTLLELMVVMVLIGIIFSFGMLSMRGDDIVKLMEQEARRLATLLALANEEAIVRGEELGVHFAEDGYEFQVLEQDGWALPDDGLLKAYTLPAEIRMKFVLDGDQASGSAAPEPGTAPPPQVLIFSSGEMTPFTVTFESRLSDYRYNLTATLMGEVSHAREDSL